MAFHEPSSSTSIFAVDLDRQDEDFVTCQICFLNFDDNSHLPKHLAGCHHYFCLSCIKHLAGSSDVKKLLCPTCRRPSSLSKTRIEDLSTNHLALRLLTALTAAHQAKLKRDSAESQVLGSSEHYPHPSQQRINHTQVANNQSLKNQHQTSAVHHTLLEKVNPTRMACDQSLKNRHQISAVHHTILECLEWVRSRAVMRQSENSLAVERLRYLESSSTRTVVEGADVTATLNRTDPLITKYGKASREAQRDLFESEKLLGKYQNFVEWIGKDSVFRCGHNSPETLRACSSILFHVSRLMIDEMSLNDNKETSGMLEQRPTTSSGEGVANKGADRKRFAGIVGSKPAKVVATAQEKRLKSPTPSEPSKNLPRAYFEFLMKGKRAGRVVFELDSAAAPIMAAKFLEYCNGHTRPGYLGSLVSVVKSDDATPSTKYIEGGQIVDYQDQLIIGDASQLPVRYGSIRNVVKEVNVWGTVVGPEFQICLTRSNEIQGATTVFGQVVEGLQVCEFISEQQLKETNLVTICACGVL